MPDDHAGDPHAPDTGGRAGRPRRLQVFSTVTRTVPEAPEPDDALGLAWPNEALEELDVVERQREARLHARIVGEEPPPLRIGRFTILEKLGEGGMGTVYAAHDDELDRTIALKFIHRSRAMDERATHRLLREAQALAKLSHPNLVTVFDVGRVEGQVYLAMELVRGLTMRRWLERSPRPWRAVLRHGLEVARALAAVHHIDLVHRDIKPDNIIIGDDGRARLLDFGLARAAHGHAGNTPKPEESDASASARSRLGVVVTHTHTFAGTPAYMAPEASNGESAGAAADQYSLCVALAEALYGARPDGPLRRGELLPVPSGSAVPNGLRRVVSRGLARHPGDRFANVAALADALERVAGRRRRLLGTGAAAAALAVAATLGAVGGGVWRVPAAATDPCAQARTALDGLWSPARRTATGNALTATGVPYAHALGEILTARVDAYASAWVDARTQVCEATWRRGEQSAALLDRRMACLDAGRDDLEALLSAIDEVDAEQVPRVPEAVEQLRDPGECVITTAPDGSSHVVPSQHADAVAASRARLARLRTAALLQGPLSTIAPLEDELAHASALGVTPLIAEAMLTLGQVHLAARDPKAAPYFERAANLAEAIGDDWLREEALRAAMRLAIDVDIDAPRARALADRDAALLERLGAPPRRAAAVAEVRALLQMLEGDAVAAEATLRGALEIWARSGDAFAGEHASCWRHLGLLLGGQGRTDEALAAFDRAADIEARWGGVPIVVAPRTLPGSAERLRGETLLAAGRLDDAAQELDAAHRASVDAFGVDSVPVAIVDVVRASLAMRRGDLEAVIELAGTAEASMTRWLGRDHVMRAAPLSAIGTAAFHLGRDEAAITAFTEALRLWRRSFPEDSLRVAEARSNLGEALAKAGRDQDAATHLRAALAVMTTQLPESHEDLAFPLLGLAQLEQRRGDARAAVALAERVVAIRELHDNDPPELARSRWLLARALADTGERERASLLAARARDGYVALGAAFSSDVAAIDAWMRAHALPRHPSIP
ncbi:MAG: tetratricopeptide repeat protein [Nannocystaceae bacterium]|nr:tetratricopeptide repeat protein [Nannocystaceae bacterium]